MAGHERIYLHIAADHRRGGSLHTLTADNGKEFAEHELIAIACKTDFYFAKPYASSQRGTNENGNGLVRAYLPKGTDFATVSDESD